MKKCVSIYVHIGAQIHTCGCFYKCLTDLYHKGTEDNTAIQRNETELYEILQGRKETDCLVWLFYVIL